MQVEITGTKETLAALEGFSQRRLSATVATALTRTAVKVRDAGKAEMLRSLDRPTPYTVRQLKFVKATAGNLVAVVGFNVAAIQDVFGNVVRYEPTTDNAAGKYLAPHIEGGQRPFKRFEVALQATGALPRGWYVVPASGARMDAYGNVSVGQVRQILSQLRIQLLAGSTSTMSRDARRQINAQRKAGGRFFVMPVGSSKTPGIYQREFLGRNITPVFLFVRTATYSKRFRWKETTDAVAARELPTELQRSIQEQINRLAQAGR